MNAAQIAALLPFQPYWLPNLALWLDPSRQVFTDSAGSFATGSNQYLFIADNVSVSGGNVDQWGSAMVSLASKPGTLNMCILTKDNQSTVRERVIGWAQGDRFFATLYDGASTAVATVTANTFGAPSLATWYFVFWYFDATAGTIGISINGGAFDTASKTGNPGTNSQQYRVGGPSARSWDGQLESVGFGKNLPGGFATTTPSTIRDMLWNGGSPRKLSSLTSAERTAIGITIGSLDSAQASLTADAIGSNTLTNNNAVTVGSGSILTAAYPGSVVSVWRDLVANIPFTQTTYASRFTLQNANGWSVVRATGTQHMVASNGTTLLPNGLAEATIVVGHSHTVGVAGRRRLFGRGYSNEMFSADWSSATQPRAYANNSGVSSVNQNLTVADNGNYQWMAARLPLTPLIIANNTLSASSAAFTGPLNANAGDVAAPVAIGAAVSGAGLTAFLWDGDIGPILLFQRGLSAPEIARVGAWIMRRAA